jgi:hypothetical protein
MLAASVVAHTKIASRQRIPTITFCEMVEHPELFFEKTIRITATFEIRTEGSTLNDSLCPRSHDDQIGVSAVKIDEAQIRLLNRDFERIRAGRSGVHPRVTAVGILRNVSRRSFDWYRYRFDIIRFESIHQNNSPVIKAPDDSQAGQSSSDEIPPVDFCSIVRNPRRYFDKTVRTEATWSSGDEFAYLSQDGCAPKFRYEIAVGWVENPLSEATKMDVRKIQSHEYGGRAIVRVVGILRNPGDYYGYFRYRFEILRIESVAHIVVPYDGTLDAGKTYRAIVRGDKDFGLALVPSLLIPNYHYATRIEWSNLADFPALEKLRDSAGELRIVFSVIADERKQMTATRWDRTIECKIIRLE